MKFFFKLILVIAILFGVGGGIYYIMDLDENNKSDNTFIDSTKDFANDVVKKTKSALDSSEIINDFKEN
jgi:hypothetical protein